MESLRERNHVNGVNFVTLLNISSYIFTMHTKRKNKKRGNGQFPLEDVGKILSYPFSFVYKMLN